MLQNYLQEALWQYNMQDAPAELVRHNENMTFWVDSQYLLRIHKHAEDFSTASIYTGMNRIKIYEEELEFLSFLRGHGMNVQIPCPNKNGSLVTLLSDGTAATMLTWLPGRVPEKNEMEPQFCFQIGKMIGELHRLSRDFPKVPTLQYDKALCQRLKSQFYEKMEDGTFSTAHTKSMTDALDVIAYKLNNFKEDAILVHADISS